MNSGISSEDSSVQYATIQDDIRFVNQLEKIVFLLKLTLRIYLG